MVGPFVVNRVFPYGTVELTHPQQGTFKVSGHRLKLYLGDNLDKSRIDTLDLQPAV